MKKLKITVDGKVYEVSVEIEGEASVAPSAPVAPAAPVPAPVAPTPASAPVPAPVPAPAPAPVAAVPAGASGVPSPLAGKVVSVDTKVGASVKEGDQILTIEAMKMNTYIYANKSGTISAINVGVGDGVEEGQVLAVIA